MRHRSIACQELVELVTGYLDDALSAAERAAVEEHLLACGNCSAYLVQMRQVIGSSAGLLQPNHDPARLPSGMLDGLLTAFRQRQQPSG